ncbi:TELO2-interacting protein 2 [Nephila pilipes]|uniref:TELO2-interacting protein 2 n=1 Tax=Nephila pilipes TaxID=299642 RepID=A0A8X6QBN5_NEPPI|nr:TELO2-interacting protein 2 [Nephila pilipes]
MDDEAIIKYAKYLNEIQIPDEKKLSYENRLKNFTLEEAKYLIDHLEDLYTTLPKEFSTGRIICDLGELVVAFGLVHTTISEDRDFSSEDFPDTAQNAVKCFEYLKILLEKLKPQEYAYRRRFFIDIILLIATHNKIYHWSNNHSVLACKGFLNCLWQHSGYDNLSSFLCDENLKPTLFKGILKKMRPSLLKDTWMLNPSSCHIFYFLLLKVKHSYLADYISDVLPPAFMFISYHATPQKVLGLSCFDYILDNIPPSLLISTGTEEAIFHSIHPLIYSKELHVIEIVFPILKKLLVMKSHKIKPVNWNEYDQIMTHLLHSMECETNRKIKELYFSHLRNYIVQKNYCTYPEKHLKHMPKIEDLSRMKFVLKPPFWHWSISRTFIASCLGDSNHGLKSKLPVPEMHLNVIVDYVRPLAIMHYCIQWLHDEEKWFTVHRLIKVLKAVLVEDSSFNMQCQIIALEILKSVIKWCWPRMEYHCFDILVSILGLQEQYISSNDEVDEITRLSEECLTLLRYSCDRKFKDLVLNYIEDPLIPGGDLLKKVLKKECDIKDKEDNVIDSIS